jgi:hypothetical protein
MKGNKMADEKESSGLFNNILFPKVFQTFRMAIQPSKMMIAFLAVVAICVAGWLMDFNKTVITTPNTQGQETELHIYLSTPDLLQSYIENAKENGDHRGVFSTLWHFGAMKFHGALYSLFRLDTQGVAENVIDCFKSLIWAFKYHYIYSIIFAVITLVVMSVAGGAICRIAALQFARDEKPGLTEALRFSTKKFTSFFTTPLALVGIIIFIGFFIFLLGLVGNIPWAGKPIMVIFMLLALIAGGLITIVLIGAVAGFNLMFPAVAYDNSDCFDAISRSFSYVFAKPWRMGFYTVMAAIYGAICYMFVRFFAFVLLWITNSSLRLGILGDNIKLTEIWQDDPTFNQLVVQPNWPALTGLESFAAFLVYLLLLAIVVLVIAFIVSFYFSANTIIYSLMRKAVDNTALEDVYVTSEQGGPEPITTEPESVENPRGKDRSESKPQEQSPPEPEAQSDSSSSAD